MGLPETKITTHILQMMPDLYRDAGLQVIGDKGVERQRPQRDEILAGPGLGFEGLGVLRLWG